MKKATLGQILGTILLGLEGSLSEIESPGSLMNPTALSSIIADIFSIWKPTAPPVAAA